MALRHLAGLALTVAIVCGAIGSEPAAASGVADPGVPDKGVTDKLDVTAPTASVRALPSFDAATALTVSYAGADSESGVKNFDVRYKVAPWRSDFGDYVTPAAWQGRSATSVTLNVTAGSDYCFSVRSRDNNDNVSKWTADTCSAVALDDRSLSAAGRWTRTSDSSSYRGTLTRSSTYRSTLSVAARGKQMALVVTTCPSCGSVAIVLDGQLWKTINTASSKTQRRVVLVQTAAYFVVKTKITLGVASTRPVLIDGLAVTSR